MWVPKGCDRCGGDLYKTSTEDGVVASCLQCGREFLSVRSRPIMSAAELYAVFHDEEPARKAA